MKTTLTLTPVAKRELDKLPDYIRRDRLLQHLGILPKDTRATIVVKRTGQMQPSTAFRSGEVWAVCNRFNKHLEEFTT